MRRFLKEWGVFIVIVLIFSLLRLFVYAPVTVDGHSMDPTLANDERLIVLKTAAIDRYDIVVAHEEEENKNVVKRVIGMPGDTITYDNDKLYINEELQTEDYIKEYLDAFNNGTLSNLYSYNETYQNLAETAKAFTIDTSASATFTITLGEDEYFLLGDNRLVSRDSRDPQVGTFSKEDITGEVKFRFWPFSSIGTIE